MPEGHSLHRIARDHQKWFGSQILSVTSPQGRFAEGAECLHRKRLLKAQAYGKHLVYQFAAHHLLHIHLGLYGKFRVRKNPPPIPRGAVRIRMIGDERSFDLHGPNQCKLISPDELQHLVGRLGPDPLRADAEPARAWERIRKSRAPIGSLLINQSVIAGIGNIYRAEILFILGIHPDRPGNSLVSSDFERLWSTTVQLMRIGVRYNRIITVPKPEHKPLSRLRQHERTHIYKRDICPGCSGTVRSWELASRKIFACDQCQT